MVFFLCALAGPSAAAATTPIGQLAPSTPTSDCNAGIADVLQPTVTSGTSYVVPAGFDRVISWSTNAGAGAGQTFEMKVFRKVSDPLTYKVVGHDGPRPLVPSTLNTFSTDLAVQPGDVLGSQLTANSVAHPVGCVFAVAGDGDIGSYTDLADGASATFMTPFDDQDRLNISAVVGVNPSNAFSFGKVKDNKNNGTATLAVNVPGPGTLSLTGKGVKAQRTGGAVASKTVSAAGTVKLSIKAKGKAKKKLTKTGKAKVKVSVSYTPTGDVPGTPSTQTKRVKLIKK